MKPGTDRAALVAQLEPLARRVQQRLGGPAPYVRIMERHRPVVKPLREHLVGRIATPLWILLGTVGIVFLDRVRERGQPVHRAGGEPAPRPGRAARARRRTRRSGAVTVDRGAASRGSGRRGRRAHRVGRRPTPGPRGAGCGRRRLCQRTHSRTRRRAPGPDGPALHGGHLCSGGVRVRPAARPPLLGCRVWAASSRPDEASSAAGVSRATRWSSCKPLRPSSCWLDRRCSCAASGSSATSMPGTTRRASSRSRSRPIAPS